MYVKWFKRTNKQRNPITGYCNRLVCTTIFTSPNLSPHRYLLLPVHWFIWRIETNHFWLVCVCRGIIQYPGLALYTFKLNWLQMMQAGLVINAANKVQMDYQEKWLQLNGTASCYKWCSHDLWARDQCIRSNTVEACRINSYLHLYICFVAIFLNICRQMFKSQFTINQWIYWSWASSHVLKMSSFFRELQPMMPIVHSAKNTLLLES